MYQMLIPIIAPVFILALVGFIWAQFHQQFPTDFVSRLVMNIGAPCLMISALGGADVKLAEIGMVIGATLVCLLIMSVIGTVLIRLLGYRLPVYLPPLLFPNIGNMGLSLCLFTFGEQGLALGLGVFLTMTVCQFSIGLLLVSTEAQGAAGRVRELASQPVLYGAAVAIVLVATGWSLPPWLDNTVTLAGGLTIPLMLIMLGVSLSQMKVGGLNRALLFSCVRLFGGFAVVLLVVTLLDIQGVMRGVLLLQFSMPAAVFNYLLAARYGQSPEETASVVVVSTALGFLLLPVLLTYVMV